MTPRLLLLAALVGAAAAFARVPATFDLRVTELALFRSNGERIANHSKVVLDEKFRIRVSIKNDGPGPSVPGWIYYAICKDAHKVIKADTPIPVLRPGARLVREFTATVSEAPGIWVVEGNIEVASPPDRDHVNNHIGLFYLSVVAHPAHPPHHPTRPKQGGE